MTRFWCPSAAIVILLGILVGTPRVFDIASDPFMTPVEEKYQKELRDLGEQTLEAEWRGAPSEELRTLREERAKIVKAWMEYLKKRQRD